MGVPVGTTPTFTLTFGQQSGVDLTAAKSVYVTFESGHNSVTKTGNDLTIQPLSVSATLTQQETISMGSAVLIQVNWITQDDKRIASEIVKHDLSKQLLMEVIE